MIDRKSVMLDVIQHAGKPLTAREVADAYYDACEGTDSISQSVAKTALDRLAKKGFIRRSQTIANRLVVILFEALS